MDFTTALRYANDIYNAFEDMDANDYAETKDKDLATLADVIADIDGFMQSEFWHGFDPEGEDPKNIGIVYTTHGDDEDELQIALNLVTFEIMVWFKDLSKETPDHVEKFAPDEVENWTFNGLYSWALDFLPED